MEATVDGITNLAVDGAGDFLLGAAQLPFLAEMSGLVLQERLNELEASIPVIVLTGHGDVPMAVQAMRNGAADFIQKPYREQALLDSINAALAANADACDSAVQDNGINQQLAALTQREMQVFEYMRQGDSSKEIAMKLAISPRTVETHRHNVLHKLGMSSVKELLLLAPRSPAD